MLLLWRSARAGGKNCQTRSPWAERNGAIGRRYAGRAGADDDRGGGGGGMPPSVRGGRGARVAEGGTTCLCDPCSLPRRGGRAHAPVRDGGGMGGGREGPPLREPAGPRLPLLLAASPPRQGRGQLPVRKSGVGGWWGQGICMVYSPASRFPRVRSARAALRTALAGSGDLVARGSARGPARVAPSARVACPTGRGRSTASRPAA